MQICAPDDPVDNMPSCRCCVVGNRTCGNSQHAPCNFVITSNRVSLVRDFVLAETLSLPNSSHLLCNALLWPHEDADQISPLYIRRWRDQHDLQASDAGPHGTTQHVRGLRTGRRRRFGRRRTHGSRPQVSEPHERYGKTRKLKRRRLITKRTATPSKPKYTPRYWSTCKPSLNPPTPKSSRYKNAYRSSKNSCSNRDRHRPLTDSNC